MPTARRTVAAAFVISLHMVLQSSGKIPNIQQRKQQVKIQEKQLNATNQTSEDTTTVIPVNPYIIRAEDYDILQDAESLQKALSIVAYEPQKIDAKKLKADATKDNATLVTANPRLVQQSTTESAPEKQYYEVPRRSLRSRRAHAKPAEGADTAQLAEEASAPQHAFELAPATKRRSITHPRNESDPNPTPSPSPVPTTTVQPSSSSETPKPARKRRRKPQRTKDADQAPVQVQIQTTTPIPADRVPRPFSMPTDASPTSSNHHDHHHIIPLKSTDLSPTASVEPPGAYSSVSLRRSNKSGKNKLKQSAVQVEHPYLPPYATDDYFFAPPQGNAQSNHLHANAQLNQLHANAQLNQLYATPYATVAVDHNHLAPQSTASVAHQYASLYTPVAVDQQHGPPYSSAPVDPIPPRQYPTPYSIPPEAQRRTTVYSTEPAPSIGTRQTYPSNRNSKRRNEQWDYNDARPTRPQQDESYTTQRRRSRARQDHTTTTIPPEQLTLGYGSVPLRSDKKSRQENLQVNTTPPTWRESRRVGRPPRREDDPVYAGKPPRRKDDPGYSAQPTRRQEERSYSTQPPRREDEWTYSTKAPRREEERLYSSSGEESHARPTSPTRREQKIYPSSSTRLEDKQSSPTTPSSQSEEQDYLTASAGSEEDQSYSTPPSRREHSQSYESSSPRRAKPTLIIDLDHTAAPNEEVVEATRPPPRRKPLPEDDEDYDLDVASPTASAEQSLDYTNEPPPQQQALKQSRPTEYQEYVDSTDYTDYTEPRPKDKDEDEDKPRDKKAKDKGKDKDKDNKQYSFSYIERVDEPLDESGEASYNVHEVSDEVPEQPPPRPIGTHPTIQRGGYKIVQPKAVVYSDQSQHQLPTLDYHDQAESQKADQEVAQETRHKPKGDEAEDLAQSAGHHHKKHHKPKKEHHDEEEGGHAEHHEGDHHEKGHKGHKGYKEHHEHDEGKKGHHDKEGHDHHYDEKEGGEKEHHDEEGHHEEHEKGEEGEKKHAYSEKGKHKKGHSTKGEHVIHKKDAYEKKIEFYDESHEGGSHEKHGAHHHDHHHKKGGHHKKGHHHKGEHEGHHGKKGHHEKGHHHHEKKGHKKDEGDHHHHDDHHKHGKKAGHEDHKHWHHKKG